MAEQRMTYQQVLGALRAAGEARSADEIYRAITGIRGSLTKRQVRARLAVAAILEGLEGDGRATSAMVEGRRRFTIVPR